MSFVNILPISVALWVVILPGNFGDVGQYYTVCWWIVLLWCLRCWAPSGQSGDICESFLLFYTFFLSTNRATPPLCLLYLFKHFISFDHSWSIYILFSQLIQVSGDAILLNGWVKLFKYSFETGIQASTDLCQALFSHIWMDNLQLLYRSMLTSSRSLCNIWPFFRPFLGRLELRLFSGAFSNCRCPWAECWTPE